MKVPSKFKDIIKETFYDKTISIYSIGKPTYDDEGGAIDGEKTLVEDLQCNPQIQNVEKIRKEYGEDIEAEVVVTCDTTKAKLKNVVNYNGIEYEIVKVIPSDTHTTLLLHHIKDGTNESIESEDDE